MSITKKDFIHIINETLTENPLHTTGNDSQPAKVADLIRAANDPSTLSKLKTFKDKVNGIMKANEVEEPGAEVPPTKNKMDNMDKKSIDDYLKKNFGVTYFFDLNPKPAQDTPPVQGQLFTQQKPTRDAIPCIGRMLKRSEILDNIIKHDQDRAGSANEEKKSLDKSLDFLLNSNGGKLNKAIEVIKKNSNNLSSVVSQLMRLNENNLVDSEMFRIIAEAETPKITKAEIIEFLNKKKK